VQPIVWEREVAVNRKAWRAQLHYAFDNTLSKGPVAVIGWLALASGALIVLVSVAVKAGGFAPSLRLIDVLWMSLLRTLDGGTMGADHGSWPFLISMLIVTFGGICVVSVLIGVITSSLEQTLESLRKGRSRVVESNHTVLLGWSSQIFPILAELAIANSNQQHPCIVVLADRDKVEMEDEIHARVGNTGRTRIVCRRGNPIDMADLEIASPQTSRSIIVLAPEHEDPDAEVIKTILALTNSPRRRARAYHIVAEIRDPRNASVARLVGGQEVELVQLTDLIARAIAQTCRQSGLSVVHTELFDFSGDEIYFQEEPGVVGKTFGEALLAYEDSAVIGLCPKGAAPRLNPPMDTRIASGDQVIAISEDDDTVRLRPGDGVVINEHAIRTPPPLRPKPERTLILGWNRRAVAVLHELDQYVAMGSSVDVVADEEKGEEEIARCCPDLRNETVRFRRGDTTDRALLDSLALEDYQHVIVLACCDHLDAQRADARTLVTLLHLRQIADARGCGFSLVSEMLDIRDRDLAEVARADDYIVSPQLASLMLSQISENKALSPVLGDILDAEGSEIYLKPMEDYVSLGETLDFYTVVESARRRGQVAIGYRIARLAKEAPANYGVVVNPNKSEPLVFAEGDQVVVVAEV
jgi:voltage-gated potassium channel Kch